MKSRSTIGAHDRLNAPPDALAKRRERQIAHAVVILDQINAAQRHFVNDVGKLRHG
jgi:hypothetical protein